jgi:3-(3-hydroxy-phenyl)propionate hydroxylase
MMVDVIVLGCGPVGATLANLLAQQGVRALVLEREASVYHLSRAGHFDAEVMRVFQGIGIAQDLEKTTQVTHASRFVDADGALLLESRRRLEKGRHGWCSDYMFFQPTLETMLRSRLATLTRRADLLLRHDVFSVEEVNDGMVVSAENLETNRLARFGCKYVVGCDGARSLVRRLIGSEHEDLGFGQRWLVVDVRQHSDLQLEKVSTHHCNPERPMFTTVLSQDILRWEMMVKDTDDPAWISTPEAIWELIGQSIRPIPRNAGTVLRSAVYNFESLVANRWREGGLLIAGDSAHRTPPFLGQGLCAGIRDAANLAWKLAAVLSGRADDSLLDTYETERKPHVREFIASAVALGEILQMADPEKLAVRARTLREHPEQFAPPDPSLGPGLSAHHGAGIVGRQFPQPQVRGQLLDEHIGHAFGLVFADGFLTSDEVADLALRYPKLRCIALDRAAMDSLGAPHDVEAALLRPDRYVHATAHTPDQVPALLESLPVSLGGGSRSALTSTRAMCA